MFCHIFFFGATEKNSERITDNNRNKVCSPPVRFWIVSLLNLSLLLSFFYAHIETVVKFQVFLNCLVLTCLVVLRFEDVLEGLERSRRSVGTVASYFYPDPSS